MADTDQEKTEDPTLKKRRQAREKGQVAQSREIPSVLVLIGALGVFSLGGSWMFSKLLDLVSNLFKGSASFNWTIENLTLLGWQLLGQAMQFMAPLVVLIMVLGVVANVGQVGFLITSEPLTPNFTKLDPISGFKRLFSMRSVIELIKSLFKIIFVGWVVFSTFRKKIDVIPVLIQTEVPEILSFIGDVAFRIILVACIALGLLAVLDFIYQRWQHEKDLRMTKQEVKDEHKQAEGDPKVKARIRSAQREMARRRMMESVPKATVVITNPTHLAIALKFESDYHAPVVVAKGSGFLAEKIRTLAKENDVPIVEQKPLAQALFKTVEIGHYIPAELYRAVAEVLAYVYRLKGLVHRG